MKFSQKCMRIFGGCVLFFMSVLAFVTAAMAASGQWDADGSYSLVIQKQFDSTTSPELLEEAKKQTYRFRVEGYRLDKDKNKIPVDDIVEIGPGSEDWTESSATGKSWKKSETLSSEGPIYVSVTEITNDVTLKVDLQEYNMGDSRAEVANLYTEAPQVRDLNSNGKIILSRPDKKTVYVNGQPVEQAVTTTSVFRIRHEWPWSGDKAQPGNWTQMPDEIVTLAPGSELVYTGLQAGRYTIEDLSVSGYKIQLGSRTKDVSAGKTGEFYINSKPGRLVITAGGTENDGGRHYYTIKRVSAPYGAEPFEDRTTQAVSSGGRYEVTNLPRGKYEVTEYTFSSAPARFKVRVPETDSKTVTLNGGFPKKYFTTPEKKQYTKFNVGGDYITDLTFGPLRNSSGNKINSNYSYDFGIRYRKAADQDGYTTSTWKTPRKANLEYAFTSPIYPRADGTLAFAVWNVTAKTGDHVDVRWTENTRKINTYYKDYDNIDHTVTLDERGWMEITAPTVTSADIGADEVTYTYTLKKSRNGAPVRTLELEPGETGKLEGLEAGTYFVRETVNLDQPDGFKMEISGDPFGSTEAGTPFDLVTMGDRTLTITKPTANDGGRTYTFTVERTGGKELGTPFTPKTVTLRAGESDSSITLPEGEYKVTPTDDMTEVFRLNCSDSTQVHAEVPSSHSATVTFTNVFTKGKLGYRYVHEYYLKDGESDRYSYEGCSPVTTVGGRDNNAETYGSFDVTKEPGFTFTDTDGEKQTYTYAYMPDNNGYGYANSGKSAVGKSGGDGLRPANQSTEKGTEMPISYRVDENLTSQKVIGVDENKSQIIILRYFRVLPEDQKGSYKYVHVYYLRNKDGTVTWEGTSDIQEAAGQLGISYPAKNIPLMPDYRPAGKDQTYHYVHNNRPTCGVLADDHTDTNAALIEGMATNDPGAQKRYYPNSNGDSVVATEDGRQIIILRYYREEDPVVTNGTYKVVHEYYLREDLEDQMDTEEDSEAGDGGPVDDASSEETESGAGEARTAASSAKPAGGGLPGVGQPETDPAATAEESAGAPPETQLSGEESGSAPPETQPSEEESGNVPPETQPSETESIGAPLETLLSEEERVGLLSDRQPTEEESGSVPSDTQPAEGESVSAPSDTQPTEEESGSVPSDTQNAEEESGSAPAGTQPAEESAGIQDPMSVEESVDVLSDVLPSEEENDSMLTDTAPAEDDPGDSEELPGESGWDSSFAGTLGSGGGYSYKFEGARAIETITAPLGSSHKDDEVARRYSWTPEGTETAYGYQYLDAVYGNTGEENRYSHISNMEWAASTQEGDQIIILRYYRDGDTPAAPGSDLSYRVVHEYYLEDAGGGWSLEGRTEVGQEAGAEGRSYDQGDVAKRPEYGGRTYTYTEDAYGIWSGGQEYAPEAGKTSVTATENGDQIIILRYVRKASPEKPGEDPPKTPTPPTKVPPLRSPQTGDTGSAGLWTALAAASLCGLAVPLAGRKKRRKAKAGNTL
ncbi:MAG: hypothetical protein HFI65_04680 [Lachnospiraceae bacterium]|nr:hypothetical protein [Lachnospiraceae bacterium]